MAKRRDCSRRARARAHDRGFKAFAEFTKRCARLTKRETKAVVNSVLDDTLMGARRRKR